MIFLISHRKESDKVPSSKLKLKYLASGHSPIYGLQYTWQWNNLPYWIAMHFKTHHVGIHQITSSQRNDIQREYDRRKAPQDALVNHRCVANAAAIINVSQKRLCLTASNETRKAWGMFLEELGKVSPEIVKLCVKPCVFRNGLCPELFSECRWNHTEKFQEEVYEYKKIFKT
jgi:thymidylate synthase ThyX